jgi:hypothetical protein
MVSRVAGMWAGEAELLAVDLQGPQGSERVLVEHDGQSRCKVAGTPALSQFIAEMLPTQAMIIPAAASDAALAFEIPALEDRGAPFGVGAYVEALMGVEWTTPRHYQAHAIRKIWASWSTGLVVAEIEDLHFETDAVLRMAWWPDTSTIVRTAELSTDPYGVSPKLHPVSRKRWRPDDELWAQPDPALERLELPAWPEQGWLS